MRRFSILIITIAFLVPSLAFAANTTFMGPIVPACAYTPGGCGACDLVTMADNILKFFVAFSVFAAAVMFAYAGFLYVTAASKHENLSSARKIFGNVLIGLILVLAAWMIVDLTLRVLSNKSLNVLTAIQCVSTGAPTGNGTIPTGQVSTVNNPVNNGGAQGSTPGVASDGTELTHQQAMDKFAAACEDKEKTGTGACVKVTTSAGANGVVSATCAGVGCTNLNGIKTSTADQAIALSKACGCTVTIVGATELGAGHSETLGHLQGYKIDLTHTDDLDHYIENHYTYIGQLGGAHGGPQYKDACGNIYTKELGYNHWDVKVNSNCGG